MTIMLNQPEIADLDAVLGALRDWQSDAAPMQLHPGDLGWYWQSGAKATAAAIRTWTRDGQTVAIGLLDGPGLVRLTTAPDAQHDRDLAERLAADLTDPDTGVLPAGEAAVEAPNDSALPDVLTASGWTTGDPWTPLRFDLSAPVPDPGVRIDPVGPDQVADYAAVHRSAFGSPKFTDDRWHTMAAGPVFVDGRSLMAVDDAGAAVAMATVWSAGPGRPGVLEPVGAHADHRGRGYGKAISIAAAAALQQLGSSCALVCTESSNVSAVAAYTSAGFDPLPQRWDRIRPAG